MTRARSIRALAAGCAALCVSAGCRPSDAELVNAVRRYDQAVIEAYRSSDAKPIEAITGEDEGRRLTALIGVKRDMGVTLDAQLLEFRVEGVGREGHDYTVSTVERWYYQDRRIGSGERVGADSTDRYWMRYRLRRRGGALVVTGADFERPPEIGRIGKPAASVEALHGVDTHAPTPPPAGPDGPPLPAPTTPASPRPEGR
jgi:hypothetical protein